MHSDQPNSMSPSQCSALESPMTTFVRLVNQQIEMSRQLEGIADGLPLDIDTCVCANLSESLPAVFDVCIEIDHKIIFPVLETSAVQPTFTRVTADRLRDERLSDQGYAHEISELLACLAEPTGIENCNAAGYMLRGFFEVSRRSAAFELEFIVPMVRRHLRPSHYEHMAALLERHGMIVSDACLGTMNAVRSRLLQ